MNTDIRLRLDIFEHPKVKKLGRRLGAEAVLALLRLWLWAAANRPSGVLAGMDAEDVELAADWSGADGALLVALVELRLLDVLNGSTWPRADGGAAGSAGCAVGGVCPAGPAGYDADGGCWAGPAGFGPNEVCAAGGFDAGGSARGAGSAGRGAIIYAIHDWRAHQAWASSAEDRSRTARRAAQARWASRDAERAASPEALPAPAQPAALPARPLTASPVAVPPKRTSAALAAPGSRGSSSAPETPKGTRAESAHPESSSSSSSSSLSFLKVEEECRNAACAGAVAAGQDSAASTSASSAPSVPVSPALALPASGASPHPLIKGEEARAEVCAECCPEVGAEEVALVHAAPACVEGQAVCSGGAASAEASGARAVGSCASDAPRMQAQCAAMLNASESIAPLKVFNTRDFPPLPLTGESPQRGERAPDAAGAPLGEGVGAAPLSGGTGEARPMLVPARSGACVVPAGVAGEAEPAEGALSPSTASSGTASGGRKRRARRSFQPPSVDEVAAYCRERASGIDPLRFVEYYTAQGWLVGRSPMRDWRAAVRLWEQRDRDRERERRARLEAGAHGFLTGAASVETGPGVTEAGFGAGFAARATLAAAGAGAHAVEGSGALGAEVAAIACGRAGVSAGGGLRPAPAVGVIQRARASSVHQAQLQERDLMARLILASQKKECFQGDDVMSRGRAPGPELVAEQRVNAGTNGGAALLGVSRGSALGAVSAQEGAGVGGAGTVRAGGTVAGVTAERSAGAVERGDARGGAERVGRARAVRVGTVGAGTVRAGGSVGGAGVVPRLALPVSGVPVPAAAILPELCPPEAARSDSRRSARINRRNGALASFREIKEEHYAFPGRYAQPADAAQPALPPEWTSGF